MIKITRRLKVNNFESFDYCIYPESEFKEFGKEYKHWAKCKPTEWGISDDGYVAECLGRNYYASAIEMVFPYGRQWVTKTAKLDFEPHYVSKNYSNVSVKSYEELEANKSRTDLAIDAFLSYKIAGLSPNMEEIGRIYRPDQKYPAIAAKRMLKTKEVKKIMADKLKEILIDKEIRAAKELGDFLDMKPKTRQITESIEMDMTHQIEDNYEKARKKLKATKTHDEEVHTDTI